MEKNTPTKKQSKPLSAIGHPKPTKKEREAAKRKKKRELKKYRDAQDKIVRKRDKGRCRICGGVYSDIHHVYGRGGPKEANREHHTKLLSVCRTCHPQPIKQDKAGTKLRWVEEILEEVNESSDVDRDESVRRLQT